MKEEKKIEKGFVPPPPPRQPDNHNERGYVPPNPPLEPPKPQKPSK